MIRRFFTFLSVVSLVLCVATCVLWVRSYWVWDVAAGGATGDKYVYVQSLRGAVYVVWGHYSDPSTGDDWYVASEPAFVAWEEQWGINPSRVIPIRWFHPKYNPREPPADVLILSYWLIVLGLGLMPARWFIKVIRRRQANRRRNIGLCPTCGYDLRATPARCPECGMVPKEAIA